MSTAIDYQYRFRLQDGTERLITLRLDANTLDLITEERVEHPEWTALEYQQCPNCPPRRQRQRPRHPRLLRQPGRLFHRRRGPRRIRDIFRLLLRREDPMSTAAFIAASTVSPAR